jgi:hypothetical protein
VIARFFRRSSASAGSPCDDKLTEKCLSMVKFERALWLRPDEPLRDILVSRRRPSTMGSAGHAS